MRVLMDQHKLKEMLTKLSKVVNNSGVVPAHRCVRINITEDNKGDKYKFTLQACNTEATMLVTSQPEEFSFESIDAPLSAVVEYKKFSNLVTGFKEGQLELSVYNDEVIVKKYMTNNSYKLAVFPEQEFVDLCIQHIPNDEEIVIDNASLLSEELERTTLFVGQDTTYPALVNVLLNLNNYRLNMYGSNQQKTYGSYMTVCSDKNWRYVISKKTVESMVLLLKGKEKVSLVATNSLIQVGTEDNYIVSSLVSVAYPKVEEYLDTKSSITFKVNKEQLQDCLTRMAIVTNSVDNPYLLKICTNKDYMRFVGGDNYNSGEEEIPVEGYAGLSLKLAVNGAMLSQGLEACKKEVHFGMSDDTKPIVIKSAPDSNDTCLIMPIRVHTQ